MAASSSTDLDALDPSPDEDKLVDAKPEIERERRRVALVTGCSEPHSLGAAICLQLLLEGFRVFATARKVESMKELGEAGCETLELDVQSNESVQRAATVVQERCGRMDVLVNNAGLHAFDGVLTASPEHVLQMHDINAIGPLRVIQAFADLLIITANSLSLGAGRSTVVNVPSTARFGVPWQVGYTSSKASFHAISEAATVELKGLGVNVVTVDLAIVRTAMTLSQKSSPTPTPSKWIPNLPAIYQANATDQSARVAGSAYTPQRAARDIVRAAIRNTPPARVVTGYGGWIVLFLAALPGWVMRRVWAGMYRCDEVKRPIVD